MTDRDPAIVNISNQKTGLVLIKSETGVTATNASPYGVQSVFTSEFRNYRLVWSASQATSNADMLMQFYTGTSTVESGFVYGYAWAGTYVSSVPAYNFANFSVTNPFAPAGNLYLGSTIAATYSGHGWLDIYSPQLSISTRYAGQAFSPYTGTWYNTSLHCMGGVETASQYTGFRWNPSAGTTTINYRLYGYRD